MADSIDEIKGMSPELFARFKARGIHNTAELLEVTGTPGERHKLANEVGIDGSALLELVNRADLMRIKGVAGVFSNLLEEAGVDTVKELAGRNPENLCEKLVAINEEKKIANRAPNLEAVTAWVTEAKALPKLIEY